MSLVLWVSKKGLICMASTTYSFFEALEPLALCTANDRNHDFWVVITKPRVGHCNKSLQDDDFCGFLSGYIGSL